MEIEESVREGLLYKMDPFSQALLSDRAAFPADSPLSLPERLEGYDKQNARKYRPIKEILKVIASCVSNEWLEERERKRQGLT